VLDFVCLVGRREVVSHAEQVAGGVVSGDDDQETRLLRHRGAALNLRAIAMDLCIAIFPVWVWAAL
jgi:hypothetical protein